MYRGIGYYMYLFLFGLLRELFIMHPINLVLDTPAQPLPERPSTAGLGEVGPLVRIGPVPDFGGVQLRFRLKGALLPSAFGRARVPTASESLKFRTGSGMCFP